MLEDKEDAKVLEETDDLKFYEPKLFIVKKLVYEHPLITVNSALQYTFQYNIYEVSIGEGNPPMFLITNPFVNLPMGHNEMVVEHDKNPFEFKEVPCERAQGAMCRKMFGQQSKTTFDDIMEMNQDTTVFLKFGKAISKEHLDEYLRSWPPEEFTYLFDDFLENDGWKVDERLRYLYRIDKLKFTEGRMRPSEIMIYQPHKIIVTNTKVGKTSLARLSGYVLDKATAPRFLGFATSDSINPGLGNGLMLTTYFDEVSSLTQILVDHILNYMEFGETEVAMGKANVKTRGWSNLVFHSNPEVPTDEPSQLLIGLNSFLQKFTLRADALGSRIACIIFASDFDRAKRTGKISDKTRLKTKIVLDAILDSVVDKIEELLKDDKMKKWLDEDIENYRDEINLLVDKNEQMPDLLKQLYKSHAEGAFRHMRGFAFKQAVIDNLYYIYWDKFDFDRFIDSCEIHLKKLCDLNIDSLRKMCEVKIDTNEMADVFLKNLPIFLKDLVIVFSKFHFEVDDKELVILEEMNDFYEAMAEKLKFDDHYQYFSQLKDAIQRKDIIRTNIKLTSFGFELYEQNNVLMLHVLPKNKDVLKYVHEKYI